MKALIIDDEPMPSKHLQEMIKKHCFEINETDLVHSAHDGLDILKETHYDILFLDVEMPQMDGFDFLKKANLSASTIIIFTTAYSDYAIDAFNANATHYILKPVQETDLIKAIRKASYHLSQNKKTVNHDKHHTISVYDGDEYEIIKSENVIWIQADGSYTKIGLKDKELMSSKRLGYYEEKLHQAGFYRCHNSYLVNLSCIDKLGKGKSGYLVLNNGKVVPISNSKKKELEAELGL
tara:strand:- start:98 stop:808 length:711 start_codon:yes stop_codon:yes gene_type:complete